MNCDEQRYRKNGLSGDEADLAAELLARRARPAREPLVVDRRAGRDHVLRLRAVHRDRFALLRLVPDEDAIRE